MSDPLQDPPEIDGIPFSFFCALIRRISRIPPISTQARLHASRSRSHKHAKDKEDYPALNVFKEWLRQLREHFSPLPPGTTAICFRLLFPQDDVKRRYHLQEPAMASLLSEALGIDKQKFEVWKEEDATGCLGDELRAIMQQACPYEDGGRSTLSLAQVDALLEELASNSAYSHSSILTSHPKSIRRTRAEIARSLYRPLAPLDAAIVTQIILKDLRPILYPLAELHYTAALLNYNSNAVTMLRAEHAMRVWDESGAFNRRYRVCALLDEAAGYAEGKAAMGGRQGSRWGDMMPAYGSLIAIPKSEKGRSCEQALCFFEGVETVWAETKYDGERAQIHVRVREDGTSEIMIYSKSKRDSTQDRHGVHHIIRNALGLKASNGSPTPLKVSKVKRDVILDAEMVAFRGEKVAEFWHISDLIPDTAIGVRSAAKRPREDGPDRVNDIDLSLGLVFFDVMYHDSQSLLYQPYTKRRELLESLIHIEPGKAILAARYAIPLSPFSSRRTTVEPEDTLRWVFAQHIAQHEEGLILKASNSIYNDFARPWVKLKKDFIPGLGDGVDLVIIGASWEKERGRILRVPPSTYTTFYVGALATKKLRKYKNQDRHHLHVFSTVSYGMDRKQLEHINFMMNSVPSVPYAALKEGKRKVSLPFDLSFLRGLPEPTTILCFPLLAEVFGAGFTKSSYSQNYELRFPRIQKIHRPAERIWKDGLSLEELNEVACDAVGRERASKQIEDYIRELFGEPPLPSIHSEEMFLGRMRRAYNELADSDKRPHCGVVIPPVIRAESVQESVYVDSWGEWTVEKRDTKPLTSKINVFEAGGFSLMDDVPDIEEIAPPVLKPTPPPLAITPVKECGKSSKRPTPQLLTPDRTPKRAKIAHTPQDGAAMHLHCVPNQVLPNPSACPSSPLRSLTQPLDLDLSTSLIWFARPQGRKPCPTWKAARKSVSSPVYSVHALFAGCGWTMDVENESNMNKIKYGLPPASKGVIVVDECDVGGADKVRRCVGDFLSKERRREKRVEVVVYGCCSGAVLDSFV